MKRVRNSLERDAISIHALYEYARLHGYVRVRFGFVDERLAIDWSLPRESDFLYAILREAERETRLVEIVLGRAPDRKDPWPDAHRGYVSELRSESFCFREDQGPGIAAADRERVFTPFFTTKEHGTGLGLAIAREFVEAHGGSLEVEGNGRGTRFVMRLPSAPRQEAAGR